ncbi:MAG: hypothetical protein MUC74_13485 [Ideonella sp.]|jgi:hypothetical protein|nr:hypothetical protein [Ideonella sp.]
MSAHLKLEPLAPPPAAAAPAEAHAAVPASPRSASAQAIGVALRLPGWLLTSHWRGELPIWAVVPLAWVLGWGLSRGLAAGWDWAPPAPSHELQVTLLGAELLLRVALLGWLAVGLLRALRHHVGEASSWGLAAVAVAALLPLGILQGREAATAHCLLADTLQPDGASEPPATVTVTGTVLQVHGRVDAGLADRVREALASAPRIRTVSLAGPGGLFGEADEIARLLVARGVDTVVDGVCASACVHMFAAGRTRWIGPQARIGLHRSGHACMPVPADAPPATTDRRLAAFLQERGVAPWFAERVLATPFDSIWQPSRDDLVVSGLATPRPPR